MLTLLLTRPAAQSEAFAAVLAEHLPDRFWPLISPLMIIRRRSGPVHFGDAVALAFTSANAVETFAALEADRSLPAFCVGARTAAAAKAIGLHVRSADGDARALAHLIAAETVGPVLHLRGAHAAADLATLLPDIRVRSQILYDQEPLSPSSEVADAGRNGRIDAIAVFSPRSARLLAAAACDWNLTGTTTVAISPTADIALAELDPARRLVAETHSRAGMIAALARI